MADSAVSTPVYTLGRRLAAEAFGTFVLVFGVIGAAMFISADTGPLAVALAVGLAVLTAAYAVGHISGGHFNPAVTLGAAAAGRASWGDVLPYLLAQFIGGILATSVIALIVATSGGANPGDFVAVSNGFGDLSPAGRAASAPSASRSPSASPCSRWRSPSGTSREATSTRQ